MRNLDMLAVGFIAYAIAFLIVALAIGFSFDIGRWIATLTHF
jgi:hypothetical protein